MNPMFLNLCEVRGTGDRVERSYPAATFAAEVGDEYVVAGHVRMALDVRKDGDKYHLLGRMQTTVELSCCRCLESYDKPVDLAVDLRYFPQRVNHREGEFEVLDDDLSTGFYREDQIDLGQLVREQLQLAAPMKPLCREECLGLCPMCGINRNAESCDCNTSWHDPRLESLEFLLSDEKRGEPRRKS